MKALYCTNKKRGRDEDYQIGEGWQAKARAMGAGYLYKRGGAFWLEYWVGEDPRVHTAGGPVNWPLLGSKKWIKLSVVRILTGETGALFYYSVVLTSNSLGELDLEGYWE